LLGGILGGIIFREGQRTQLFPMFWWFPIHLYLLDSGLKGWQS
jgi:hypothetical protein